MNLKYGGENLIIMDNYEGETKAEKCKNWLMSKGIDEPKLEHIREIFINGYKANISLNILNKINES